MSNYEVAELDQIEEMSDGRVPWRPVRHHLGITAFGVNALTGQERRRPDHQRARRGRGARPAGGALRRPERARARFEIDGEKVDAPPGSFVFVTPGVKRTAFAEEPGTTLVAVGAAAGQGLRGVRLGDLDAAPRPLPGRASTTRPPTAGASSSKANPEYAGAALQPRLLRGARRAQRTTRSTTCGRRSSCRSSSRDARPEDSDFDPIRDEPGFKELVGAS